MTAAQLVYSLVGRAVDSADPLNATSDLAGLLYDCASRKHDRAMVLRERDYQEGIAGEFAQNAAELRDLAGYALRVAGTFQEA
jgi:hypothetical protein